MSTPACYSTETFLGTKMCDFLSAHRHLRPAPPKEGNKCPLFSQSGLFKDRWPHADFFFFLPSVFFQLLSSAARTAAPDCLGSDSSQLCSEQRRKGKGEGCLQGEVRQESAFTIPLTLGQGQTECTFQQKAPSGHKLSPCKGPWKHLWGKKGQTFNGECLATPCVRTGRCSRDPKHTQRYPAVKFSGCRAGRSGGSGGGERGNVRKVLYLR